MKLENKVALITGGGSGIGFADPATQGSDKPVYLLLYPLSLLKIRSFLA